jgi:hypothetical protein
MTNALVFIEACTICNRVQRTYLGRRSRRRTPLVCDRCARPWIKWICPECDAANHEQVETLPRRGAHSGICGLCEEETDKTAWTRSTLEEAREEPAQGPRAEVGRPPRRNEATSKE